MIQCQKCSKTHLSTYVISKFFPGLYPGPPIKRAGKGREGRRGGEWREGGEERGGREGEERGGREGRKGGEGKFRTPHFLKQSYALADEHENYAWKLDQNNHLTSDLCSGPTVFCMSAITGQARAEFQQCGKIQICIVVQLFARSRLRVKGFGR
jgi:hypothetical protein